MRSERKTTHYQIMDLVSNGKCLQIMLIIHYYVRGITIIHKKTIQINEKPKETIHYQIMGFTGNGSYLQISPLIDYYVVGIIKKKT